MESGCVDVTHAPERFGVLLQVPDLQPGTNNRGDGLAKRPLPHDSPVRREAVVVADEGATEVARSGRMRGSSKSHVQSSVAGWPSWRNRWPPGRNKRAISTAHASMSGIQTRAPLPV